MSNVRNFLDVSTGHLDAESRAWLERNQNSVDGGTRAVPFEYGWFCYAIDERDDEPDPIPDVLWAIYEYAHKHGCPYVLLDRDAEAIEDLPYFEDAGVCAVCKETIEAGDGSFTIGTKEMARSLGVEVGDEVCADCYQKG